MKDGGEWLIGEMKWAAFKIEGAEKLLDRKLSEDERVFLQIPRDKEQLLTDDLKRLSDFKFGCQWTVRRKEK